MQSVLKKIREENIFCDRSQSVKDNLFSSFIDFIRIVASFWLYVQYMGPHFDFQNENSWLFECLWRKTYRMALTTDKKTIIT